MGLSRTQLIAGAIDDLLSGDPNAAAAARARLAEDEEERKTPRQRLTEALAEVKLYGSQFEGIKWELQDVRPDSGRRLLVHIRWPAARGDGRAGYAYDWPVDPYMVEQVSKAELQERFQYEVSKLVRDVLKVSWAIEPLPKE